MQASEIDRILHSFENFGGIFPADKLPECKKGKFYIINSAPSSDSGKHWLAVYIATVPEFFDSLGHSPGFYHINFEDLLVEQGPTYMYNSRRLQNYGSSVCGQFCIYYILSRIQGNTMDDIVSRFDSHNLRNNDISIVKFYEYFE